MSIVYCKACGYPMVFEINPIRSLKTHLSHLPEEISGTRLCSNAPVGRSSLNVCRNRQCQPIDHGNFLWHPIYLTFCREEKSRGPSEAGERTRPGCWRWRPAIANFFTMDLNWHAGDIDRSAKKSSFRRDAGTNTRDGCAPRKLLPRVVSFQKLMTRSTRR